MPDRPSEVTKTGKFPVYEGKAKPKEAQARPPTTLPEVPKEVGSTTGAMPAYREPADESASRDENIPPR